jgi:phosphoribosylamine--glycine ligase
VKVLVVGSGGREHTLAWKIARSPRVSQVTSLPGNPGMAQLGPLVEGIEPTSVGAVATAARQLGTDLVVIGPEAPLAAGLADVLTAARIPVWGPNRAAARLESSKTFAKEAMDRAGVPTAGWAAFTELSKALAYLAQRPGPYVVKADGLAAGKGVLVTESAAAAEQWVTRCLTGGFGLAGNRIVIEDHLEGPELSVFALCSGTEVLALEPARDYKRLLDGDLGPNTGGMGAFSPVPDLPVGTVDRAIDEVFKPILRTMAEEGNPYVGFLYAGLVLTSSGPRVLEFNCRLGDPETQVVLPRLETDLVDLIEAGLAGTLHRTRAEWSNRAAVNVVLAAAGYPESPRTGDPITVGSMPEEILIFHAGTALARGRLVSSGGRVLNVVGGGETVAEARSLAYSGVGSVGIPGMQYRRDIGL